MKIDLIIQGPFNSFSEEVITSYRTLPWVNKIIVSCWHGDLNSNVADIVVKSKQPENSGIGNRNCHILSSINGINLSQSEFSFKLRSDQKISLSSMNDMYKFYNLDISKIHVAGFYKDFPFHPRDHIFLGKTSDLKLLFDIPFDPCKTKTLQDSWPNKGFYAKNLRAECYIASNYLSKLDKRVKNMLDDKESFLYDFSPRWSEAQILSKEIMSIYFKPFFKIDFQWPKHNLINYHYDFAASFYGEYWSDYKF